MVQKEINKFVRKTLNMREMKVLYLSELSNTQAHDQDGSSTKILCQADGANKFTQTQVPKWNILYTNLHKQKYE